MTELFIRPITRADQAVAREIILAGLASRWRGLDPSLNRDLDDIESAYCATGGLFFVGEVAGDIVATCALTFDAPQIGRIERMSVRADWQGHGFGRKLTNHLIETARAHNCHTMMLETTSTWSSAIQLYKSCGFTYLFEKDGDTHMQKTL